MDLGINSARIIKKIVMRNHKINHIDISKNKLKN